MVAREQAGGRSAALRVHAVSFHCGDLVALDDASLAVDAGQVNVLLGPNYSPHWRGNADPAIW